MFRITITTTRCYYLLVRLSLPLSQAEHFNYVRWNDYFPQTFLLAETAIGDESAVATRRAGGARTFTSSDARIGKFIASTRARQPGIVELARLVSSSPLAVPRSRYEEVGLEEEPVVPYLRETSLMPRESESTYESKG